MKTKIKNFYKNSKNIIYTILSALIIVTIIFILQDVAPFGRNSMLTIDFFHQYGPMLGELYNRVKEHTELIYSFNMAMGLPFFRNFFNYLSSPFNLLIFLFDHRDLVMSYSLIIGLKAITSALTMLLYLRKKFNNKSLYLVPLSLFYAFSAYYIAYYWNIMWLDGMVFLPLIVLGIERLVDHKKPLLYIISLTIMLFANYFIGYMICIFSVLYFIAYLVVTTDKIKIKNILQKCGRFAAASLISGCLAAFFLIPMYYALKSISATSDVFPTSQYYAFTLQDFIFNHFTGVGSTVLSSGVSNAPNISCGVLAFALLPLFIMNPKIRLKTKIAYLSLLGFLILSFVWAPLDFIWHGFHVPNDLPYRYSFLYSFVMIIIAAYSLLNIKDINMKKAVGTYVGIVALLGLMYYLKYDNINTDMITLNFAAISIYFLLFIIFKYFKSWHKFIPLIFIVTATLECAIYVNNNWSILQYIDEFYADYNNTEKVLDYIDENDDQMYRVDRTTMLTFNDPSWYNYYGQTTFSSMEYENMAVLQHQLGLPGNQINSYYYKQTTPVYDLMFDIKYFIGDSMDLTRYSLYYQYKDINVYKSSYNLGLMYGVNSSILSWNYTNGNPFTVQNDYMKRATGTDDNVFEQLDVDKSEAIYNLEGNVIMKYTVTNTKDNLYFYLLNSNIDFIVVDDTLYYLNDNYDYVRYTDEDLGIKHYQTYNENYIINSISNDDTYTFYVGYNYYYDDDFYLYTINNDVFEKDYNILSNNKVNITDFEENNITANITADEDMTIYTSIPYDTGWTVYVDGDKVDTYSIGNALLGFNVSEGYHDIKLEYNIKGFKVGIIISISALVALIGYCVINKNKKT